MKSVKGLRLLGMTLAPPFGACAFDEALESGILDGGTFWDGGFEAGALGGKGFEEGGGSREFFLTGKNI